MRDEDCGGGGWLAWVFWGGFVGRKGWRAVMGGGIGGIGGLIVSALDAGVGDPVEGGRKRVCGKAKKASLMVGELLGVRGNGTLRIWGGGEDV